MPTRQLFPALRCRMGDWVYYVTFMSFKDIKKWIRPTDEIHKSKRLSEWIQRELRKNHAQAIAAYLQDQPERMFNALFVGVYGGEPQWGEIQISMPTGASQLEATEEELDMISRSVGVLYLSGEEKLFAIDGQHRVAGIKLAVGQDKDLEVEEVTIILVGHRVDPEGRERTRRLFTTLNKTAKRVSKTDIIALDEDNGAAIVTREMIDEFEFFRDENLVSFGPSVNIPESDVDAVTNVVTLYNLVLALLPCIDGIVQSEFTKRRPNDEKLETVYEFCRTYWRLLVEYVAEYQYVIEIQSKKAGDYRKSDCNHLLFRPVGQRAFAEAVSYLVKRMNMDLESAVRKLSNTNLWLHEPGWHHILWNPIDETMMARDKDRRMAFAHLLNEIGRASRLPARQLVEYQELIEGRDEI